MNPKEKDIELSKRRLMLNEDKKKGRINVIIGSILAIISLMIFFAYGPVTYFRELWITSAMTTLNHKYLATWFYSQETIDAVMANNIIVESEEETNVDDIIYIPNRQISTYASKYEEEILKRDPNNSDYKIIPITGAKYKGHLAVIYDASKVSLAQSKLLGTRGDLITTFAKSNNAKIAINAGGFVDEGGHGNGGSPTGIIISNNKLIWEADIPGLSGGLIGFNQKNILVLSRQSANDAIKNGIRDAVSFGPFLIVNGKASFVKGNGGWGLAPRTAIGQRRDGIVLMLVIDGRQSHSIGADMLDLVEILQNYGAYNASNLDGGSSTAMVVEGKVINKPSSPAKDSLRYIPNAFIMK